MRTPLDLRAAAALLAVLSLVGGAARGPEDRLAALAERYPVAGPYLRDVARNRARLEALSARDAQTAYATALRALAEAELRAGMYAEAVGHLEQAVQNMRGIRGSARLRLTLAARFWLGVAHLGFAQRAACGSRGAPACVPPLPALEDTDREALTAAEHLRAAMGLSPGTNPLHDSARWLHALARHLVGEAPPELPSTEPTPPSRFVEIGREVGLDGATLAGGLAVEDFDGDGWFDVVLSSHDLRVPLRALRNVEGRTFERVDAGLVGITGGRNLVPADYDGDGDVDLFVARGGVLDGGAALPDSLLRNEGSCHFVDASSEAGLSSLLGPSWGGAWADYDGDGDLDLFVVRGTARPGAMEPQPSVLLRNDEGVFTDVSRAAGVRLDVDGRTVAWSDYDEDGDPDLFVGRADGPVVLLRNDGGTFRDAAADAGLAQTPPAYGLWLADFDGDLREDLLLLPAVPRRAGPPPLWRFAAWMTGSGMPGPAVRLYAGRGGRFEDLSDGFAADVTVLALGAGFGDLDDDGRLDLHVGTGYPGPESLVPDLTLHGRAQSLDLLPLSTGLGSLAPGNAVAFADWDRDGDQDIFVQAGGYAPGGERRSLLFDNRGAADEHGFVALQLRGTGDPTAVGAIARLEATGPDGSRWMQRRVGAATGFGAAPLELHFGLRAGERVEQVAVRWPGETTFVPVAGVARDGRFIVTQGENAAAPAPSR